MSGLKVQGLSKTYGSHPVLTGVDLDVPVGAIAAVLGASGVGKTTLLRVVAGFERPEAGTVAIGGRFVDDGTTFVRPEARRVGYVPQDGALFPHLTVEANVGFGVPKPARRGRARELLEMVGLADTARRFPHQLSGGQQQRVALARALAVEPELMLLDEPFHSLDARLRATVRAEVEEILRKAGTTAVLVTHDQDEALSMADIVAVMRGGSVAQCASPRELYTCPIDPDVARFVGDANLLACVMEGSAAVTALGRLSVVRGSDRDGGRIAGDAIALVRPEQIEFVTGGEGMACRVTHVSYLGPDTVVRVVPEGTEGGTALVVRTGGRADLAPGAVVWLRARDAVLVWPKA